LVARCFPFRGLREPVVRDVPWDCSLASSSPRSWCCPARSACSGWCRSGSARLPPPGFAHRPLASSDVRYPAAPVGVRAVRSGSPSPRRHVSMSDLGRRSVQVVLALLGLRAALRDPSRSAATGASRAQPVLTSSHGVSKNAPLPFFRGLVPGWPLLAPFVRQLPRCRLRRSVVLTTSAALTFPRLPGVATLLAGCGVHVVFLCDLSAALAFRHALPFEAFPSCAAALPSHRLQAGWWWLHGAGHPLTSLVGFLRLSAA
jgi:hypothetical protein